MVIKLAIGTLLIVLLGAFLAWRKRYRGLALGVGLCVLTLGIGLWAIFQSRASTAAIGLLFLPFYGVFSGGMAWLYRNLIHAENRLLRAMGWLSLALSLVVPVWLIACSGKKDTVTSTQYPACFGAWHSSAGLLAIGMRLPFANFVFALPIPGRAFVTSIRSMAGAG